MMDSIELTVSQHEQMALLVGQLNTTRTVAEAFVGYFAKELGVNLQVYQFNADSFRFEPVGFGAAGGGPRAAGPEGSPNSGSQLAAISPQPENGKVEA